MEAIVSEQNVNHALHSSSENRLVRVKAIVSEQNVNHALHSSSENRLVRVKAIVRKAMVILRSCVPKVKIDW